MGRIIRKLFYKVNRFLIFLCESVPKARFAAEDQKKIIDEKKPAQAGWGDPQQAIEVMMLSIWSGSKTSS